MTLSPPLRQPHLYRPCVGIMLINAKKEIFLGARRDSKDAYQDNWQMPQGGIESGEEPREAALRELFEETSIPASAVTILASTDEWLYYDLPPSLQKKLWGGNFLGQRQLWILLRLEQEDTVINLNTAHPEFRKWRWGSPQDAIESAANFKKDIYAEVVHSFQPWLN